MTEKGWIKLHRQLIDWEWYSDINVRVLFLHCLLMANHEDKNWRGNLIQKGQFITSLENLSISSGLSLQTVRTCIRKLKSTGEITCKSTNQYSIITINNWDSYQETNMPDNKQLTNEQQTINKRLTTNKNDKNEKNEKEIYNIYGEFQNVKLTDKEFIKLNQIYGDKLNEAIETLSSYIASSNKKYKSHYAVLGQHNWVYKKVMNRFYEEKTAEIFEKKQKLTDIEKLRNMGLKIDKEIILNEV